jgi:predicted RNA-binding Zn-ribbon protein involved in translation (DUF1610 family)
MKPHLLLNQLNALEDDWNLAGSGDLYTTRTRGSRRSSLELGTSIAEEATEDEFKEEHEAFDGEDEDEEDMEEEEEGTAPATRKRKKKSSKPANTRVILEVVQVEEAFSEFTCPKCHEQSIEVKLRTICIATSIALSCKREECDYIYQPQVAPSRTTIHEQDDQYQDKWERNTDYAVNVLYVLGFMSMGDAHSEAARMLGLLPWLTQ